MDEGVGMVIQCMDTISVQVWVTVGHHRKQGFPTRQLPPGDCRVTHAIREQACMPLLGCVQAYMLYEMVELGRVLGCVGRIRIEFEIAWVAQGEVCTLFSFLLECVCQHGGTS